jgi:hypothetical protein
MNANHKISIGQQAFADSCKQLDLHSDLEVSEDEIAAENQVKEAVGLCSPDILLEKVDV